MGFSRRFLNLIVNNRIPATISLRRIDLTRQQLFNTTTPARWPPNGKDSATSWDPAAAVAGCQQHEPAAGEALAMEMIRLPSPSFSISSSAANNEWTLECIPIAGRDEQVFCNDHSGHTILFDANTRQVEIMPDLHRPKWRPISIFVPSDDVHGDDVEGSLLVMESVPDSEVRCREQLSRQFEAFVRRKPTKSWHHLLLPPPPFVRDRKYRRPPKISSYAVIGSSSSKQVRISTEGAGTYSLDTVRHTWSPLGEHALLPFLGRVEYVPELKLWFGISDKDWSLAAADLSTAAMDSSSSSSQTPPLVMSFGMEFDLPKEWRVSRHPQLVSLGSGRFCIMRFFHTWTPVVGCCCLLGGQVFENYFVVLTGVEVVRRVDSDGGDGKVEQLQMVKHRSWYHICFGSDGTIETVF